MMQRIVAAETLDSLAENDPAAMRSRRDLRRAHRVMGTRSILLRALRDMMGTQSAKRSMRILELGAGDGSLMLGVARALAPEWRKVEITLLDRQSLVDEATIDAYAELGWEASPKTVDVLDWAAEAGCNGSELARWDMIIANLFLHHFQGTQLDALLSAIATRCLRFFACEPRRARLALVGSHLIGAIGTNAVTREDAVLSVRAGFCGNEIALLWPDVDGWTTKEYPAGLFSHCFRAERTPATERH